MLRKHSKNPRVTKGELTSSKVPTDDNAHDYFLRLVSDPRVTAARRSMAAKWLLKNNIGIAEALAGLRAVIKGRKSRPSTRDRAQRMLHNYERKLPSPDQDEFDNPGSDFNRELTSEFRRSADARRSARRWAGILPFTAEQTNILKETAKADELKK